MMQTGQSNRHHQYTTSSAPRGGGGYRGSTIPVHYQPTPNLNQSLAWQQYGAYQTSPSSGIPVQTFDPSLVQRSHRTNPSVTNMALIPSYSPGHSSHGSSNSSGQSSGHSSGHGSSHSSSHSSTRDDSVKSQSRSAASTQRPPLASIPSSGSQPALSPGGTPKMTPDRYRRPSNSNTQQSRSQSSNPPLSPGSQNAMMYHAPSGSRSVPNLAASPAPAPGASMDDSQLHRRPSPDEAKKMRRRSVHTIQSTDSFRPLLKPENAPRPGLAVITKNSDRGEKSPQPAPKKPVHVRKGSSDSASSSRSSHSRSASVSSHFFYCR